MRDFDNICDLLAADEDGKDGSPLVLTPAQFRKYSNGNMLKRVNSRKKQ